MRDSGGSTSPPREMPLLLGPSGTAPEMLLLIGVPGDDEVLHVRVWNANDWAAPPKVRAERAGAFLKWLESQSAAGRTMNQSLYALRLWLRREGTDQR